MNYQQALDFVLAAAKNGIKYGLERISALLDALDNPHNGKKIIHVAGTNGKGSICRFIESVLLTAGYRVGVFCSPHIARINEYMRFGGEDITDGDFGEAISAVVSAANSKLLGNVTTFEILTAAAFWFFDRSACDFIVLEAGMGGGGDATNVISAPLVAVIGKIALDHTAELGESIVQIARAKSGIIKRGCRVVLAPQDSAEAEEVIVAAAQKVGAELTCAFRPMPRADGTFNYRNLQNLKITLRGVHQLDNAATAIDALIASEAVGAEDITKGLLSAISPFRLEVLSDSPRVYADAAHNPDGARALTDFLSAACPERKIRFVMGVLADKDYRGMIREIVPIAEFVCAVTPENSRGFDAELLAGAAAEQGINAIACLSAADAYAKCIKELPSDGIICFFGSFYLMNAAKKAVCENN